MLDAISYTHILDSYLYHVVYTCIIQKKNKKNETTRKSKGLFHMLDAIYLTHIYKIHTYIT
jgi:hypothetical protein